MNTSYTKVDAPERGVKRAYLVLYMSPSGQQRDFVTDVEDEHTAVGQWRAHFHSVLPSASVMPDDIMVFDDLLSVSREIVYETYRAYAERRIAKRAAQQALMSP